MELEGKAAIVTGGGSGVGRATALALARGGCAGRVDYSRSREGAEQAALEAAAVGVHEVAGPLENLHVHGLIEAVLLRQGRDVGLVHLGAGVLELFDDVRQVGSGRKLYDDEADDGNGEKGD